jgi:hypothetical protein
MNWLSIGLRQTDCASTSTLRRVFTVKHLHSLRTAQHIHFSSQQPLGAVTDSRHKDCTSHSRDAYIHEKEKYKRYENDLETERI